MAEQDLISAVSPVAKRGVFEIVSHGHASQQAKQSYILDYDSVVSNNLRHHREMLAMWKKAIGQAGVLIALVGISDLGYVWIEPPRG